MHPIYSYALAQMRREELLQQAECARLLHTARLQSQSDRRLHQQYANWLGSHMVKWGQKLEQFGTHRELPSLSRQD